MNNIVPMVLKSPNYNQYLTALGWDEYSEFTRNLIGGNISNFSTVNFLQHDSDYVSNIIYFPILIQPFHNLYMYTSRVSIGKVQAPITETLFRSSYIFNDYHPVKVLNLTILTRPHSSFLDYEPYTKVTFYFPFFEPIEIPCRNAFDTGFQAWLSVDFTNGHATLYITDDTDEWIIATRETTIGIQLPLGAGNEQDQIRNALLSTVSLGFGLSGGIIGAKSGDVKSAGGMVKSIGNYGVGMVQNSVDTYSGRGGSGNKDSLARTTKMYVAIETVTNVKKPEVQLVGRPLNQNKYLYEVHGFTQVGTINFDPMDEDIYNEEINEIITLLQSGVIL